MPHVSTTIHRRSRRSQNRHSRPRSDGFCGLASDATGRRYATPAFFRTLLVPGNLHAAFDHLTTDMRAATNPEKAPQMAAYMKDHFVFLGVTSPERKAIQKPFLATARSATPDDVLDVADLCWSAEEREFQYVGADLLRARSKILRADDLDRLHELITAKSWWDTVDGLAAHPVGTLVSRFPDLRDVMDQWIDDGDFWVARTAILASASV